MSWDFYNSKDVKTRKQHRCHLCNLDIPKGTVCFYESGKHDGDIVSRWAHNECAEHWTKINKGCYDDDWIEFEYMSEVCDWTFCNWQEMIGVKYNVLNGEGV